MESLPRAVDRADLLWRGKGNLARRHLREFGDGSYLVNFGKRRPVQIRVIEYQRQGHPEIYRLIKADAINL